MYPQILLKSLKSVRRLRTVMRGNDTLTGESGADAFRSDPEGLDQLNTDAFDTVSADLFSE